MILRIYLAAVSWGTNDADTWYTFGKLVGDRGLIKLYETEKLMNHPPLMPLWARAAYLLSGGGKEFAFVFKLPMIAADGVTCWLLWWIGRRTSAWMGLALAATFSLLPISILITGHHCNTEPIYVMFSLAAVLALESRRPMLGGLLLGLSINIKLVPIILVPPLLASFVNRRELLRFLGGLCIMAVPSIVMLCIAPSAYWNNVVKYKSDVAHWGVGHMMLEMSTEPTLEPTAEWIMGYWFNDGRYVILAASITLAAFQWKTRRFDRYTLAAVAMTLFLIITPGFGLQYLLAPAAFLLVAWPAGGALYGVLSGMFALAWYLLHWNGKFPIRTIFVPINPLPGRTTGILAWGWLVICFIQMIRQKTAMTRSGMLGLGMDVMTNPKDEHKVE